MLGVSAPHFTPMMADKIVEEIETFTAMKMDEVKKINEIVEELERQEEVLKSRADSRTPDILLKRLNLGDNILLLRTELEHVWSDLHSHRAKLMMRIQRV